MWAELVTINENENCYYYYYYIINNNRNEMGYSFNKTYIKIKKHPSQNKWGHSLAWKTYFVVEKKKKKIMVTSNM